MEGFILTKSLNCAAYIIYFNKQEIDFFTDRKTNKILFKFADVDFNRRLYNKYKNIMVNQGVTYMDMVKYNQIIKKLKETTRNYKYNKVQE